MGRHRTTAAQRAMLAYMMCIGWQWPLWAIWITLFPFLIATGLWAGALGTPAAVLLYLAPPAGFALFAGLLATWEARATYAGRPGQAGLGRLRRAGRILPYLAINAGMLPHHLCAFLEGLMGPMHAEFERTPKTAAIGRAVAATGPDGSRGAGSAPAPAAVALPRKAPKRVYLLVEATLVMTQAAWAAHFVAEGNALAAIGSGAFVACVVGLRAAGALPGRRHAA